MQKNDCKIEIKISAFKSNIYRTYHLIDLMVTVLETYKVTKINQFTMVGSLPSMIKKIVYTKRSFGASLLPLFFDLESNSTSEFVKTMF